MASSFINETSVVYDNKIESWDYLLNCYKGGRNVVQNYLYPWINEENTEVGKKIFERRKKLTPYANFGRKIVKAYNNYIYREAPDREEFPEFLTTITGKNSWEKQIKATSIYTAVTGKCFLLVEKDQIGEGEIANLKEQKDRKLFPYLNAVPPNNVYNWTRNQNDEIVQIAWYQIIETRFRVFYWDVDQWAIHEAEYDPVKAPSVKTMIEEVTLVDAGPNPLGIVPVVEVIQEDTDLIAGSVTWFNQIVNMDISYYNKLSVKNLNIDQHALGILVLPDSYNDASGKDKNTKVGVSYGYFETADEKDITRFVSPDTKLTVKEVREDLDYDKMMIYFIAGLTTAKQLNMPQSVEAKEFDFIEAEKFLTAWANVMEQAEQSALEIVGLYENQDFSNVNVKYHKEFKSEEIGDLLDNALSIKNYSVPSELFQKFVSKDIITRTTKGKATEDEIKAMHKEVDDAKMGELENTLNRFEFGQEQ